MERTRRLGRLAAFVLGCAAIAVLVVHAGAGSVLRTVEALRPSGLALITALHAPVLAAMGLAWWCIGRRAPGATAGKFIAARFVRDAVAEVLPFSQLGGFALGVRALSLAGVTALRGGLSMFADLVAEFAAKLPYVLAGIVVLLALEPRSPLVAPLAAGLALAVCGLVAAIVLRRRLGSLLLDKAARLARRRAAQFEDARQVAAQVFAIDGRLPSAFLIHVACWFFGAFETWITLRLMGVPVTIAEALVIDSLVSALRTFAFMVPGAVGVQEGSYILIAALFGIAPAAALALSLARRARELLLGIPGLTTWQVLEARAARSRAPAE